ncbi:hypothetical protein [Microtetraspora niveoalba]|uniref:hypothetical protein n=1 Tax=Microtetraspora niveoalba TaxID=46175 RepID=UPI00082BED38|nr:hypothetical protein [Microtetraspora niveoalba]
MRIGALRAGAFRAGALLAAISLAACASADRGDAGAALPAQERALPHGYVEGAEELAEPRPRLVIGDAGTGAARVLDLVTGAVTAVAPTAKAAGGTGSAGGGIGRSTGGAAEGFHGVGSDGRFAYLDALGGTATRVVDGGVWTVDHGDHSHYYLTGARDIGVLPGPRAVRVLGDAAVTAVSFADGTARVLDRAALEKGDLVETARLDVGRHGVVVPYGEHLLVAGGAAAGTAKDGVDVRARDGRPAGRVGVPCPEPLGAAVTRRGAVFGCADGALLVTVKGGRFTGEKIRYPDEAPRHDRAREFHHRPGSATLAARAGDAGVWVLDVSARGWTFLETGPTLAVTATGDGAPVLSLSPDGTLRAYDPGSGEETAATRLLAAPATGPGTTPAPVIQADRTRAYVSDPAAEVVHEIDYNDDLRRARTFDLGFTPGAMVETGW